VILTSGSVYTFSFVCSSGSIWAVSHTPNTGQGDGYNNIYGSGIKMAFRTYTPTFLGGNIIAQGAVTAGSFQVSSDKRLKSNIVPVKDGVSTIMKLNPVHYDKKSLLESKEYSKSENGFIAQEIQKILPFIVKVGTDKDKLLSVDYISIIPVLTKALQEQQKAIQSQQKQIDALKLLILSIKK
jgi:hypothetical protein